MNKISVFCFILSVICILAWSQEPTEMEIYYSDLLKIQEIQPIGLCFKISSLTDGIQRELMFGTCIAPEQNVVNTPLPYGNPDDLYDSGFDYYLTDPSVENVFYNAFFTVNGYETKWDLVIITPCTLEFTLLGGAVPGEGGSLKLCKDEVELLDIVNKAARELDPGQYTIKYVPAPDQSTTEADVTFNFCPGWNLLHLPIVVYSDQRRDGDNWDALNNLPRLTLSGRSYVQGGEIRCGEAFWVFHNGPNSYSLTVLGYEPLPKDWSASKSGWNFTGTKNDTTINDIYEWANGQYQTSSSSDSSQGHWIYKK